MLSNEKTDMKIGFVTIFTYTKFSFRFCDRYSIFLANFHLPEWKVVN